jgi:hypothetical protein
MPGRLLQRDSPLTPPATISSVDKLSPTLSNTGSTSSSPIGSKFGRSIWRGPFTSVCGRALGGRGALEQAVVSRSPARIFDPGIGDAELARIRDDAVEREGRSRLGTAEVDLILLRPRTPGEVACHGAQAAPSHCGRLPMPRQPLQPDTCFDKLRQATFSDQLFKGLGRDAGLISSETPGATR